MYDVILLHSRFLNALRRSERLMRQDASSVRGSFVSFRIHLCKLRSTYIRYFIIRKIIIVHNYLITKHQILILWTHNRSLLFFFTGIHQYYRVVFYIWNIGNEFISASLCYLLLAIPNMKSISLMQFRMLRTSGIYVLQITSRHELAALVSSHLLSIALSELREIMMVHDDIRVTLISALRQTDDARCVKCYWLTLRAE